MSEGAGPAFGGRMLRPLGTVDAVLQGRPRANQLQCEANLHSEMKGDWVNSSGTPKSLRIHPDILTVYPESGLFGLWACESIADLCKVFTCTRADHDFTMLRTGPAT